jgi:AcrR family transcriptional regulator
MEIVAATKRRVRLTGAERREIILDQAAQLFASKGFYETSVGEIAAASGVSKIVVYDHFASKEALFIELTKSARDGLLERGRQRMAADGTLEARLRSAIDAFFLFVQEQPARARILFLIPKGEPEMADLVAQIQDEGTRALTGILLAERDLLKGERDRAERLILMTEFLKIGLHGLVEWWIRHPEVPRERLVETAMAVAWDGLRSHMPV